MNVISISIRDLHARTGHFVRKASEFPVVVTDSGRPVAEIRALSDAGARRGKSDGKSTWENRKLLPGFKAMRKRGALRPKAGQKSLDEILDDIRADSQA